jgi:hypothetical protein
MPESQPSINETSDSLLWLQGAIEKRIGEC